MKLLFLTSLMIPILSFGQNQPDSLGVDFNGVRSSTDSLVRNFVQSIGEFVQVDNPLKDEELNATTMISEVKRFDLQGNVSVGFDYGLLTAYVDTSSNRPLSVLTSEADMSVRTFGLPMRFSYNYSSLKNPLGVNNYVRLSLDKEQLKDDLERNKKKVTGQLDEKIASVQNSKDLLSGKLGYGEVLKDKLEREMDTYEKKLQNTGNELKKYESTVTNSSDTTITTGIVSDTLSTAKTDSLRQLYSKTYANYQKAKSLYDTVCTVYNTAYNTYKTYGTWEAKLNEQKSKLDSYDQLYSKESLSKIANDSIDNRKQGFLESVTTFDLGLTYPETTALSKNNVPVKGINVEFQHKQWYSSVAAGVMMNNLMVSADLVQNKLVNTQNLFNQFDYQNIRQKGFLVSAKSGYGTKHGNHALIGMSYLTKSRMMLEDVTTADSIFIPSASMELDLKWAPNFLPRTSIDFVYGKTSDSKKVYNDERPNPLASIFSNDRTNTSLLKINQPISRIKSEFTGSIRWIDPDADTRSFGVLQPNNIRYELRSSHQVMRRIRVGLNYRQDRNNVARQSDSTIQLHVIGGQLDGSIGKRIIYFASVNYLTQEEIAGNEVLSRTNNYMYGAGVSAQYELHDVKHAFTVNYNDYLLTDTISTGLFRNIGIQNMSNFKKGQNVFSVSYFRTDVEGQEETVALIIGDEYTLRTKKFRLTCGLKGVFRDQQHFDIGGKLEFVKRFTKYLEWSIKAEKLVLGDFYNLYDRGRFDQFPYVFSTKFNFIIN